MKKTDEDVHPLFQYTVGDSDLAGFGSEAINNEAFVACLEGFPILPPDITPKMLLALGMHFNAKSKGTFLQQNFWVYMMMECDTNTYNDFVKYHSEEIQERVSPRC